MSESVRDETSNAVGKPTKDAKPRPGRPRIHENDAARKRAYNKRRAEAHARARVAERRAKRWEAETRELRARLEVAGRYAQRNERQNTDRHAQLLAKIARLEDQLAHAVDRKNWAVERTTRAIAEAREVRDRVARAERAVQAYGTDDRLDKLELKARVRQLEEWVARLGRRNADLELRLERWREKRRGR